MDGESGRKCYKMYVFQTDCARIEIYEDVHFEKHEYAHKPCCSIDGDLCITTKYETTERQFEFLRV